MRGPIEGDRLDTRPQQRSQLVVVVVVVAAAGQQHDGMALLSDVVGDPAGRGVEAHGLAGLSVNRVVAQAGVAKGTFYVHFHDRAEFVDALHQRFHAQVHQAVSAATADSPPGAEQLARGSEAYLDVCLAICAVKALAVEARSDPALAASMAQRHDRFVMAAVPSLKAMGWPEPRACAQLIAAMTAEVAMRELDAGRRLPASRRALRRFLGVS